MIKNILVTGGAGFIGMPLIAELFKKNYIISSVVRDASSVCYPDEVNDAVKIIPLGDIADKPNWDAALMGIQVVIHLAARVHVMSDKNNHSSTEYNRTNVEATMNLAYQAAKAGVKRFIYLSSIKVNGESTSLDRPFLADDLPMPQDPYSFSKYQAELELQKIASKTGMELVIIRPPLVYGPGVKANFLNLMNWLSKSLPLPLGAINNRRSFVSVDNLIDLIVMCINHPRAANQIFLVSDGEDVSTSDLLLRMGVALGRPARLIAIPIFWLDLLARAFGYRATIDRLCSSLRVDIKKTHELLGWSPKIGLDEGLRRVVRGLK